MVADFISIVNPPSGKVSSATRYLVEPLQPLLPGISFGFSAVFPAASFIFLLVFLSFLAAFAAEVAFFITALFSLEALPAPVLPPQPL